MTKIGILGYGEIGKSIEQVYLNNKNHLYDIRIKDLEQSDDLSGLDVLNVCIVKCKEGQNYGQFKYINLLFQLTLNRAYEASHQVRVFVCL